MSGNKLRDGFDRGLRWSLTATSVLAIVAVFAIAMLRIGYPFELEWIEGGMREVVRRVLAGAPIYTPPAIEYVPFLYPPLYFHAAALIARLTGEGFVAMRLVSLAATLVSFVLVARLATRVGRPWMFGVLAAGWFAASYARSGAWLDLGRVDALFLALTLGAIAALGSERPGLVRAAAAGVLFAIAFHTKQSAAFIALPFGILLAFSDRRAAAALALAFAAVAGGLYLAWNRASDGWYAFYVFDLPRAHRIEPAAVAGFWIRDLIAPYAVALGLGIAGFLRAHERPRSASRSTARGARRETKRGNAKATEPTRAAQAEAAPQSEAPHTSPLAASPLYDLALALGMIAAAWISRMHEGGAENVLIPAHAAVAILAARGLARITQDARPTSATWPRVVLALALVQFLVLAYNPQRYVPARADAEAGTALVDRIRALPGDVWTPAHGYLATLAGKESHAHLMAVIDVLRAAPGTRPVTLQSEIEAAFAARRFGALVLDDNQAFEPHLGGLYRPASRLFQPNDLTFLPRSGAPLRPLTVWIPEPR